MDPTIGGIGLQNRALNLLSMQTIINNILTRLRQ